MRVGPATESIRISPFITNRDVPESIARMVGIHPIVGPVVEVIPNVTVLSDMPFDSYGNFVADAVISPNYRELSIHAPAVLSWRRPRTPSHGVHRCLSLVNAWSGSYYHWVAEQLPRVLLAEVGGFDDFYLIVGELKHKWQLESLSLLGYNEARILPEVSGLAVEELLVPSFPRILTECGTFSVVSSYALGLLRVRSTRGIAAGHRRRLWISRSRAVGRHVVNEAELIESLRSLGFEFVVLEHLSFHDQVNLFSSAEVVVGPHGAGLVNVVFCRPGTKVVEVVGEFVNGSFLTLCAAVELKYFLYFGKELRRIPRSRSDIFIDPDDFCRFLEGRVLADS